MPTVHQPPDTAPKPLPERVTIFREAVDQAAAERGLPPEPWAA